MGKREADIDGIKYYYDPEQNGRGSKGATVFLVPCSKCGAEIKRLSYGRNAVYVCDKCKVGEKAQHKAMEDELYLKVTTPGERRLFKAMANIQKQVKDFTPYMKPIARAKTAAEKFGSVPEAMVAIELLRLGHKVIPQQKIGKYRVDFYLPDIKTVLEVDGELYHKGIVDNEREATILLTLGLDTRIIHLPAELISKDIRKLKKVLEKMP